MINKINRNPIISILLKNSNLTNIQFESLLIDYYSEDMSSNHINYDKKALLRSKKVSRGSFSRTLNQGRKNIISSIYTIILLNYIGIYDTYPFEDYKNIAEKLSEYTSFIEKSNNSNLDVRLKKFELELMKGLQSLANPKNLKSMWYHNKSHL